MLSRVFLTLFLFLWVFPSEILGNQPDKPETLQTAMVGMLSLNLVPPEGLVPIIGLSPEGDAFLGTLNEKFKLIVLGAYANPAEYLNFVAKMKQGVFCPLPNIALISIPRKMPTKVFDGMAAQKEMARYVKWFSRANNRPVAALLEFKANGKLSEKLGMSLDFSYRPGKQTEIYDKTADSLSLGVLTTLHLFGGRTDNYLAASAVHVADKIVFISMIGADRSETGINLFRQRMLAWRDNLLHANLNPTWLPLAAFESQNGETAAEAPLEAPPEDLTS
ncbi:MAG: hypothetical protein LBF22_14405 [Deltaproteobacteria bacterium]|jgi:hypothetical protein|nr:hypothetical protein [Deltaproteobacteria bacterium]